MAVLFHENGPTHISTRMILVTGGAGFIGSNLQASLYADGIPTIVADRLGSADKWRNLAAHPRWS